MPLPSRVNVLLTTPRFHPHVGGTEIVVERLAERFAARGHHVTVATGAEPGAPERETRNGYDVRRFALRRVGKFRLPPRAYFDFVLGEGWDVVHLHGQRIWSTDHLYPRLGRAKSPLVFTPHGFYQWHVERTPVVDALYYEHALPRAARRFDRIAALTETERREMTGWGIPGEKIAVVPGGFEPAEFGQLPTGFRARHGIVRDEPLLLYVGGFYPNKRVDRLVEVAAATGARLAVVGKDQDPARGRAHCEALAERLGARVAFLGTLPRRDVLAAYRESDLLLLASTFEGYGLVLLEAMAAGLPFVSTPVGAGPELSALGAGALARGVRDMAERAKELLADPARRRAMGEAGKAAVGTYSWDRIAERYLDLYAEVVR